MTLLMDNVVPSPGRVLAVAAGAALAAGLGVAVARTLRAGEADRPPAESQWRRVGRLTQLNVYPLKSGRPVAASTLLATDAGVCGGALRDRVFVAVGRDGCFVSARTHPLLLMVDVSAEPKDDDVLFVLRSPRVADSLTLSRAALAASTASRRISVQGTAVSAVDCGDEAAAWIRKAAVTVEDHGEATAVADLRLAFYPRERSDREPRGRRGERGIYSDQTSYHILTQASLDALNARLPPRPQPVSWANFRPNFLVDGPAAFEEDGWGWVRMGQAVFRVVMPCGRCLLTTVDPETGVKDPDREPLKTLQKFRSPNAQQQKKMGGSSPMLGLRLAIHECGEISVGDDVYVA